MILNQNFIKGRQNKDADIRLLPKGEYREAYGLEIINSEGSDVGAIEPMYSNKQLTNYGLGANPVDMGSFADKFRKKLYWLVLSDNGSFLFEWDAINETQSIVLADTRAENERVFALSENHFVTGIQKVISQDVEGDLLLITDDNMQPLCINIERAKTYGINGFEEEDIFLIKKPPRFAPQITPTYTNDGSNNMEEKFSLFAYRYRYLDGEYSAPSDFSNYSFTPRPFDLDYFTLDNLGMINTFNAVKIDFNTGEKQVTDIQVLVKDSLSNSLRIIETFNKEKNGWGDNLTRSLIFSNSKTIIPLPEDQLFRSFDNVPRLAKALSLTENIPVFSNYVEGYDIKDTSGNPININYDVLLKNNLIVSTEEYVVSVLNPTTLSVLNPVTFNLRQGNVISITLVTEIDGITGYKKTFFYILEQDYFDLTDAFNTDSFQVLLEVINSDFSQNFNQAGDYTVPASYTLLTDPVITYNTSLGLPNFVASPVVFTDGDNADAEVDVPITFTLESSVVVQESLDSSSCKTNRNYEVGVVYMDKYGRRSTVLTSESNTIFVPQQYSTFQNKLVATINHVAPYWADRYKLVVKSNPLAYQTIYVNEFFTEDFFTWCRLEGNNKDKVAAGDFLIVKKAGSNIISEPIKVKVLEAKVQEKNFITGNTSDSETEIIERAGFYIKIKPVGFSMDRDDFQVFPSEIDVSSEVTPIANLDLFTTINDTPPVSELAIPEGASINLYIRSSRQYDAGEANVYYEREFFAQVDYASLEDWFTDVIFSRNSLLATEITGPENRTEDSYDLLPRLSLERDADDLLSLRIVGIFTGNNPIFSSNQRLGRVEANITVSIGNGVYVFETFPKQADTDIFYEIEQSFEIVNGNHKGTVDQDNANGTPATVEMDFFNCYTQGNGIESYRVRDDFNSNYLTVDTRPSATSVEEYREIRRFADQTYGKAFIESTNINGLNEFNLSNANFKELDKQYGSVQITVAREGNVLVLQEEKAGYVLFGKDLIVTANGEGVISKVPEILGQYVPYAGRNGIGRNPESLALDGNRVYWVNSRGGSPVRLSIDGTTEINYGMVSEFRSLFIDNPTSKKLGAFDPYTKKYTLNVQDEIAKTLNAFCGNIIQKTITRPFTYILNINTLLGETVLNFTVTEGSVNVSATYEDLAYPLASVTGSASIIIPRTDLTETQIQITVTPNTDSATFQFTNVCPVGIPLKVISIVLADENDLGTTITNRYRWGASSFYSEEHLFGSSEISQFTLEDGLEGTSKFPERGTNVNIQSYKSSTNTGEFDSDLNNKLGYLISTADYDEDDIATILSNATFPTITSTQLSLNTALDQATFAFSRATGVENLYLIWDYRN